MKSKKWWFMGGVAIILICVVGMLMADFGRPPRIPTQRTLYPGLTYERRFTETPRDMVIHIAELALDTPTMRLFVTPGTAVDSGQFIARTTSEFATEFGLQFAVNGSFFHPMYSNHPADYYPHSGDPIKTRGLIISDGTRYAINKNEHPVICIDEQGQASYQAVDCPPDTAQAIFGNVVLVQGGAAQPLPTEPYYIEPRPRTIIAINKAGDTMWLIVVDGRQPYYSDGATLIEMTDLTLSLGAEVALNLDGGGSSAMIVVNDEGEVEQLNAPIHTRIPLRERPIATHLGVYVEGY